MFTYERAPNQLVDNEHSALNSFIRIWEHDEFGILIGMHTDMPNYDPWDSYAPDPEYLWGTSGLHSEPDNTGTELNNSQMQVVAYAIYLLATYGGTEGREAAISYNGMNIYWANSNNNIIGKSIWGYTDGHSIVVINPHRFDENRIHTPFTSNKLIETVTHEGLHGVDYRNLRHMYGYDTRYRLRTEWVRTSDKYQPWEVKATEPCYNATRDRLSIIGQNQLLSGYW